MSLMDLLLNGPSAQDKYAQAQQLMQAQAGPSDPRGLAEVGGTPPGRGIFGNDQVDVLNPDDPRLVSRFGLELARPAMRSLTDVLREYGFHGDAGGGYRSTEEQAALRSAKPGLAAPVGGSYHQEGLAIDLASVLQNPQVSQLLQQAGWNQFSPGGEPWHWSYGVTG